jgi:hypothetical protein
MGICDNCRFNKKGYCSIYKSKNAVLAKADDTHCVSFKAVTTKTNTIKKDAVKQEKRLAEDIGARQAPKSGAISTSPEDMILGNYVIESKATKGKSISVREEWISSLRRSPIHMGKIPTLVLEFVGRKRYIVMEEADFKRLVGEEDKRNELQ